LAAVSGSKLAGDPQLALLLAIEAGNRAQTTEVRSALEQAVLANRLKAEIPMTASAFADPAGHDGSVGVQWDPSGVSTWRIDHPRREVSIKTTGPPFDATLSQDGRYVAALTKLRKIKFWRLSDGSPASGPMPIRWLPHTSFSPRGDRYIFNTRLR